MEKSTPHTFILIQWDISAFMKVYSTSDMYIINMMYILLNIIEMRRLIHVYGLCGLMEYIRIPSVYNISSCISLIQLKLADNCFHEISMRKCQKMSSRPLRLYLDSRNPI